MIALLMLDLKVCEMMTEVSEVFLHTKDDHEWAYLWIVIN